MGSASSSSTIPKILLELSYKQTIEYCRIHPEFRFSPYLDDSKFWARKLGVDLIEFETPLSPMERSFEIIVWNGLAKSRDDKEAVEKHIREAVQEGRFIPGIQRYLSPSETGRRLGMYMVQNPGRINSEVIEATIRDCNPNRSEVIHGMALGMASVHATEAAVLRNHLTEFKIEAGELESILHQAAIYGNLVGSQLLYDRLGESSKRAFILTKAAVLGCQYQVLNSELGLKALDDLFRVTPIWEILTIYKDCDFMTDTIFIKATEIYLGDGSISRADIEYMFDQKLDPTPAIALADTADNRGVATTLTDMYREWQFRPATVILYTDNS